MLPLLDFDGLMPFPLSLLPSRHEVEKYIDRKPIAGKVQL